MWSIMEITSTASIPCRSQLWRLLKGQLKSGDKVVFVGFGAGLTWGAMDLLSGLDPIPTKKHINHRAISVRCAFAQICSPRDPLRRMLLFAHARKFNHFFNQLW